MKAGESLGNTIVKRLWNIDTKYFWIGRLRNNLSFLFLFSSMPTKIETRRFGENGIHCLAGSHPLTKMLQDSVYEIESKQDKVVKLGNTS